VRCDVCMIRLEWFIHCVDVATLYGLVQWKWRGPGKTIVFRDNFKRRRNNECWGLDEPVRAIDDIEENRTVSTRTKVVSVARNQYDLRAGRISAAGRRCHFQPIQRGHRG